MWLETKLYFLYNPWGRGSNRGTTTSKSYKTINIILSKCMMWDQEWHLDSKHTEQPF